MQRSNKAMLVLAGAFAAVGLAALLIMTWFQWRATNQMTVIATRWPLGNGLGLGPDGAALEPGNGRLATAGPAEQSSLRLLGAIEQLDKRIHEFQGAIGSRGNGAGAVADRDAAVMGSDLSHAGSHPRVPDLLNQANSLMNLDKSEAALAGFDEVLSLEPNHTEALVKKGAILERMHRLNEAIECYDRAIAVDDSLTAAYLHKGGLCNRLERFKEALECYEKALRTHGQGA